MGTPPRIGWGAMIVASSVQSANQAHWSTPSSSWPSIFAGCVPGNASGVQLSYQP